MHQGQSRSTPAMPHSRRVAQLPVPVKFAEMESADTVTIITPTTGHANLHNLLLSVQKQTHPHLTHLLVVDGPAHEQRVKEILARPRPDTHPLHVLTLPWPTGLNRFNGHRIYAAASFLCASRYVSFLDEDNTFEPEHIESMLEALKRSDAKWAFSLRRIVDAAGVPITVDNCESLGPLHATAHDQRIYHVDTSCYLLPTELAAAVAPLWYRQIGPDGSNTPDSIICQYLMKHTPRSACNMRYSVNYRVGNRPTSVKAGYFFNGNTIMAIATRRACRGRTGSWPGWSAEICEATRLRLIHIFSPRSDQRGRRCRG